MENLLIVPVNEPPTISETNPTEIESQVDVDVTIQSMIYTTPVEL